MEEFPSNAHREKVVTTKTTTEKIVETEPKKIERVVIGDVTRRKPSLSKRFKEQFFAGAGAQGVFGYILTEVLIPAAKDMIADAGREGLERMLFGDSRGTTRRPASRGGGGYVAYNRFAPSPTPRDEPRQMSRRARTSHEFDEILIQTRIEAEEALDRMFDLIARYEVASVKDFYELVGAKYEHTDEKWGWTDLRGSAVIHTRHGYLLDLPKPQPID